MGGSIRVMGYVWNGATPFVSSSFQYIYIYIKEEEEEEEEEKRRRRRRRSEGIYHRFIISSYTRTREVCNGHVLVFELFRDNHHNLRMVGYVAVVAWKEGRREGGREGRREGGKEGRREGSPHACTQCGW